MKRVLKKVLICILIVFIINNFIISGFSNNYLVSYAASSKEIIENTINTLFGTVVGLLTWPLRIIALSIALGMDKLMSAVAYIESNHSGGGFFSASLTPFDILFNTSDNSKIKLLDINFFKIDSSNQDSIIFKFRTSIAVWYYVLRNLSAAILLVVLVYVGIRMTLTAVSPEQKASYKKMLVDWIVSLAIIFVIQYIMLFVINVNDAIVGAIQKISDSNDMSECIDELGGYALAAQNVQAIAATVIYCMLIFQTFGLFISYFNRMLTLAFLTIISPLITLTYSIDKMGDGKAQALNTWLKEYIFTILIQPFHCIIYMTFINVAMNLLADNIGDIMSAIASGIIVILCINFVREAEKLVRKIFAFGENGKSGSLASGLLVASAATNKAKSIGKGSVKTFNSIRNGYSKAKSTISNAKVEAIAIGRYMSGKEKNADGSDKSFDTIKDDIRAEELNKKAEKIEEKYKIKSNPALDKKIDAEAQKLIASGVNANLAKAKARKLIAETVRDKKKAFKRYNKHPRIRKARGTMKKVKNVLKKSETLRELGDLAKMYSAAGAGLAIGSGYYGTTGKIGESILASTAMYKGVNEAFKYSTKTLVNDVNDRLSSLGVKSESEAIMQMDSIASNTLYEDDTEAKRILDEIKDALNKAGLNKDVSTRIENNIRKEIDKNPTASINDIVNKALKATASGLGSEAERKGLLGSGDIRNLSTELTKFKQMQGIYNDIKDAGDIGVSPDQFIKRAAEKKSFADYTTDEEYMEKSIQTTANNDNKDTILHAPSDEEAEEFIEPREYSDVKESIKNMEQEVDDIRDDLAEELAKVTDPDEIIKIKKEAQAKINQIIAGKVKIQDITLDREVSRLNSTFKEAYDKVSKATTDEAKRELKRELENLQKQYDTFIAEANLQITEANTQIDRNNIKNVKGTNEIVNQKAQLMNQKVALDMIKSKL